MVSQTRRTSLLLALSCASASLGASRAWSAPDPSAGRAAAAGAPRAGGSATAKFYRISSRVLGDEAAAEARGEIAPGAFPLPAPARTTGSRRPGSLSAMRRLPWMSEEGSDSGADENVFLEHWDWQFSFLEERLTGLRAREPDADEGIRDLYYATKDGNKRVYTVSLESDDYRDIRMSYLHSPGMQTFRCLMYPRDGDLSIMGMGIMKMGGSRNLSILDYHPLPPAGGDEARIADAYTSELLEIRRGIPSMDLPMSRRSFDSDEERRYFTELPLLGRCDEREATPSEAEAHRRDSLEAHRRCVARHIELTRALGEGRGRRPPGYALGRHAEFDTHLSEREPAGPFLRGVFGPEVGGRLVHNVIFPLSKHGLGGRRKTEE